MDTAISRNSIAKLLQHSCSRWVTRERPKIDRIACPWLIRRFIDPRAEFLYVPSAQVLAVAKAKQAIPYDVPNVQFSHRGPLCSFDAFIADFALDDPVLVELALIVRGADTGKPELTPQSPGLL
ncbi:MAG: chromate resistance protein ChrB domain-containing protein, partial [Pseudomonadota bacterium]